MGVISGYNHNEFVSSSLLYSKIKREFKSFSTANLIDEAEFATYTEEVLRFLGIGAMKESETVLEVEERRVKLPSDFREIFAAYRCSPCSTSSSLEHSQGKSVIRQEVKCEIGTVSTNKCEVSCDTDKTIRKITTEMFINDCYETREYNNVFPLRLSPNVKDKCAEDCINMIHSDNWEMTINDGYIYTHFDGAIYLKYYAFPLDEGGMPMIPNILEIEKAVEWYIKYQILLNFWFSDDVSNIQNKWAKAEEQYNKWLNEARFKLKLPAFSTLLNQARNKRSQNLVTVFSKQYLR